LLPVPVVGELRYGALDSRKAPENLGKVEGLLARCQILNVTAATADVYARLRLDLKQKGKPIPENDVWIAALCVEHQVPLAASDAHFDAVDGLKRWKPEESGSEPTLS
jgi:tRNA(fMet)-specific endonuclease VapC